MDAKFFGISRFPPYRRNRWSKISSDQKRLFFAVSLYPLSFFANAPFKHLSIQKHYTIFHIIIQIKVLMQGKSFQRCTHFLYCSVVSLGGKVNTRRMSKLGMESIFTKIIYEIFRSYMETILWIFKIIKIQCF